jgi:hypothetical protein
VKKYSGCLKKDRLANRFILRTITICTIKCSMELRPMDFSAAAWTSKPTRRNTFRRHSSPFTTHKWRLPLLPAKGLPMKTTSILQLRSTIRMGKSSHFYISPIRLRATTDDHHDRQMCLNQRIENDTIRCY